MIRVIVCAYNCSTIIRDCLDSVHAQTAPAITCTVVDDCSSDNTADIVALNYPEYTLVRNEANQGPAIGRNRAITGSDEPIICIIDSDVVLPPDWIEKQLKILNEHPDIGIAAGTLIYPGTPEIINSAGASISHAGFPFDIARDKPLAATPLHSGYTPYAASAAWLIRRSVFDKIGLFDETFFYPCEDADLAWRAALCGIGTWFNSDVHATHHCNYSTKSMSSRNVFNQTKNRIRSILKNNDVRALLLWLPIHCAIILMRTMTQNHRGARIRALLWNITSIRSTLSERSKIQRMRTVADRDLFNNCRRPLIF